MLGLAQLEVVAGVRAGFRGPGSWLAGKGSALVHSGSWVGLRGVGPEEKEFRVETGGGLSACIAQSTALA